MIFRHLRNVWGFFSAYYLGSVLGRGPGRRRKLSERENQLTHRRIVSGIVRPPSRIYRRFWEPVLKVADPNKPDHKETRSNQEIEPISDKMISLRPRSAQVEGDDDKER